MSSVAVFNELESFEAALRSFVRLNLHAGHLTALKMKLPQSFFVRDTRRVARELLGKKLVRVHRSQVLAGWITEVEACTGTGTDSQGRWTLVTVRRALY